MSHQIYDTIILGSGPAGFSCAMQSSKFDKKVLIVEAEATDLGGAWVKTGTVPSKALRESAKIIYDFVSQYGEAGKKPFDMFRMADLLEYKKQVLEAENEEVRKNIKKNLVETVHGFGTIIDNETVEVTTADGTKTQYKGKNILISTGSHPEEEEAGFKIDHQTVLNHESVLGMTHIPKRIVIVGSGINALEYATVFDALGSRVTILNPHSRFLAFLDDEIHDMLLETLKDKQVSIYNGVKIEDISYNNIRTYTEVRYATKDDPDTRVVETEKVLFFGRRVPNTKNIGLDTVGIELDEKGFIAVDHNFKTTAANIYAAGDVIGYPALASASFNQGRTAARDMFAENTDEDRAVEIPFGIYAIPEISSIGLTVKEAEAKGINVGYGRAYYNNISKATITKHGKGLLKIVFNADTEELIGVQIIGEGACDLIHLGQSLITFKGKISYFINNVLNHPTYTELYRIAAFNGLNRLNKAGVKYKEEH